MVSISYGIGDDEFYEKFLSGLGVMHSMVQIYFLNQKSSYNHDNIPCYAESSCEPSLLNISFLIPNVVMLPFGWQNWMIEN